MNPDTITQARHELAAHPWEDVDEDDILDPEMFPDARIPALYRRHMGREAWQELSGEA